MERAAGCQPFSQRSMKTETLWFVSAISALEEEYPVLWADALYEKVRQFDRVVGTAVLAVDAVGMQGLVHILVVEPMAEESGRAYPGLFESLKERGMRKVWLVAGDAHKGLRKAVSTAFLGAGWQRCKVRFMRDILSHCLPTTL